MHLPRPATLRPLLAFLILALPALVDALPADSLRAGAWGALPLPGDSTMAEFRSAPKPAWEWAVDAPYELVKLPFAALRVGLRQTLIWTDESGMVQLAQRIIGPHALPGGLLVEFEADGLGGLGVGIDLKDAASRGQHLRASLRQSLNAGSEARLGLRFGDAPGTLVLTGGHSNRPDQAFYGIGPLTVADDEAEFTQELGWGGIALETTLPGAIQVELSGVYSDLGCLDHARIDDAGQPTSFDPLPPGAAQRSRGPALALSLQIDSSEENGRPDRGGVIALRGLRFFEQGEGLADFWHLRGSLERFVGLWNSDQTLALRGVMSWIEPEGDGDVAFTRLPASENPNRLRGYAAGRWRDRGLALVTLEYRWPLWAHREAGGRGVDAMAFGELGQVFPHLEALGEKLKHDWGGGLRWIGGDGGFGASLQIGFADEGTRFSLQFEQAFQSLKGGVFNGREASLIR